MNGYQAEIKGCTTQLVASTAQLQDPLLVVSHIHCARLCATELHCELAVFQTFANGSKSCTLLQLSGSNGDSSQDFTASVKCSIIYFNPCLNGGILQDEICICSPEFCGERCEYVNPGYCNGQWRTVFSSPSSSSPPLFKNKDLDRSKLKYQDTLLDATVVFRAALSRSSPSEAFNVQSHLFLEKSSWNSTAASPRRRFLHFMASGSYQTLTFNFERGSVLISTGSAGFDFIVRDPVFRLEVPGKPDDCELVRSALAEGFDIYEQTTATLYDNQSIVLQISDIYKMTYVDGHFTAPPEWCNFKMIYGSRVDVAYIKIGQGSMSFKDSPTSVNISLSMCWMALSTDQYGQLQVKKLASYLQRGHGVRVYFDNVYYSVIEVIQIDQDSVHFFLEHHMTKTGVELLDTMTYGVRAIVDSSGHYLACVHVLEGETVKNTTTRVTSSLRWFVDTKTWTMAYSVFSNGSAAGGSVALLSQGVLSGMDVRLWIKWTLESKSRYMETQTSTVTPAGQVSTEGIVTWATDPQTLPRVTLSPQCSYEYVLVTSDGYMEAITYNVFTAGKKAVVNDVMITWFLN
ncbi:hypothetical protein Btru_067042 [Bulinus truncatus]|nr:hypothetical protein Btru_067042 [Bulinus truncatus]